MHFGLKILHLLTRAGLTQEELAERLGVSQPTVARWTSGKVRPHKTKTLQLANYFGISADTLMDDSAPLPGTGGDLRLAEARGSATPEQAKQMAQVAEAFKFTKSKRAKEIEELMQLAEEAQLALNKLKDRIDDMEL